jgi:hypothetical protein
LSLQLGNINAKLTLLDQSIVVHRPYLNRKRRQMESPENHILPSRPNAQATIYLDADRVRACGCCLLGPSGSFYDFVSTAEAQDRFREPFTAERHYELPRYTPASHIGHPPSRVARKWQSMSAR